MRILHTMLRVGDLQRSVDFYTRVMGMNLLRTTERPEQKYSLAFVAYGAGNADGQAELELTYNHGVDRYEPGTAYGHIAIAVDDVADTCARIRAAGGAEKVNSFTRFYLALLGQFPYSRCPSVPVELVLLPRWFPINLYAMSS